MAKLIRFDLPMNGKKVKDLDELRDNITVEILDHYKTSLLAKWLQVRGRNEELVALEQITASDDVSLLKSICELFDIDADDWIIAALLEPEKPFDGLSIAALRGANTQKFEEYIRKTYSEAMRLYRNIMDIEEYISGKITINAFKLAKNYGISNIGILSARSVFSVSKSNREEELEKELERLSSHYCAIAESLISQNDTNLMEILDKLKILREEDLELLLKKIDTLLGYDGKK
jgi:hypothetical protein